MRFFLIAAAILLIARNGLYRTQWKCPHYATPTTSSTAYVVHYKQKQIAVAIRKKSHSVNEPLKLGRTQRYVVRLNFFLSACNERGCFFGATCVPGEDMSFTCLCRPEQTGRYCHDQSTYIPRGLIFIGGSSRGSRDAPRPPFWVKFFSFSCSFWER